MGLASSSRVLPKAEAKDPGQWWVLEEAGHDLQRDDQHCRRDMIIRAQAEKMLLEEPSKDGCSRGDEVHQESRNGVRD